MKQINGGEDADGFERLADEDEAQNRDEDDELGLEEVDGHVDALQAGILEDVIDLGNATLTNQISERKLPTKHLDGAETCI